jgi:EpsI family protein
MKTSSVSFFATLALLLTTLVIFKGSERTHAEYLAQPLDTVSHEINGWVLGAKETLAPEELRVIVPTDYISRLYRRNSDQLGLFVAFYAQQRAGESMHSPRNCLPSAGWEIWKHELVNIPLGGRNVEINKYFIENQGRHLVVFYWYQSKDRIIANEYLGKILLIRDTISDGNTSGALVRITVLDDPDLARQALDFSMKIIPQLQRCFRSPELKVSI